MQQVTLSFLKCPMVLKYSRMMHTHNPKPVDGTQSQHNHNARLAPKQQAHQIAAPYLQTRSAAQKPACRVSLCSRCPAYAAARTQGCSCEPHSWGSNTCDSAPCTLHTADSLADSAAVVEAAGPPAPPVAAPAAASQQHHCRHRQQRRHQQLLGLQAVAQAAGRHPMMLSTSLMKVLNSPPQPTLANSSVEVQLVAGVWSLLFICIVKCMIIMYFALSLPCAPTI